LNGEGHRDRLNEERVADSDFSRSY
jgi:hypothetical protein